jgi:hypothetical protein
MMENKQISIRECAEVLELAMDSVEAYIPHEVIEATIKYLNEYAYRKSWDGCSEDMGR